MVFYVLVTKQATQCTQRLWLLASSGRNSAPQFNLMKGKNYERKTIILKSTLDLVKDCYNYFLLSLLESSL